MLWVYLFLFKYVDCSKLISMNFLFKFVQVIYIKTRFFRNLIIVNLIIYFIF